MESVSQHSHLYNIIERHCSDLSKKGLFLIDMPTGFGKTHSVLDYIFDVTNNGDFKKKIFFITNLKKNLPYKDLASRFHKVQKDALFEKKFLFADSNLDLVIANLSDELISEIPYNIQIMKSFQDLKYNIKHLQKKNIPPYVYDILRKNTQKIESDFRNKIHKLLVRDFPNVDARLEAIKNNKDWKWLGSLYPTVFTKEKEIIFMSIDKFLNEYATIIDTSMPLYNSSIIKDSIIFIDEFDAAKDIFLKHIINKQLEKKINYLNLFNTISKSLFINKFHKDLTAESPNSSDKHFLQNIIDANTKIAREIHDNYSLMYSHKLDSELVDNNRAFLFHDCQYITLNTEHPYITTNLSPNKNVNIISFSKKMPGNDKNNLLFMLNKLRGFINYFEVGIVILANNYLRKKHMLNNSKENYDHFTVQSALHTVLAEFHITRANAQYFIDKILMDHDNVFLRKKKDKTKASLTRRKYDLSFYEKGFRYYAFEDNPDHDLRTEIDMNVFNNTPEKILSKICEDAQVIGISATATVNSVLGNFDLTYLKNKLGTNFEEVSNEDKVILHQEFANAIKGYNDIDIVTKIINGSSEDGYSLDSWLKAFSNKEFAEAAFNLIEQQSAGKQNTYNKERYLRIALVYKEFITNDDIQSLLCILTKHPREDDPDLNLRILYQIFNFINVENNISEEACKFIFQLDGEEYDYKKSILKQRLENGDKVFVISAYQTVGAGQNFQYAIPENIKSTLKTINNHPTRNEKDFDAIYLDTPTNLLISKMENLKENDIEYQIAKYVFQIESLQESCEISLKESHNYIKNSFRARNTKNLSSIHLQNLYKCISCKLLCTKIIIQALGRICRTNLKKNKIYIFADKKLSERIDLSVMNDRLLNPEAVALFNELKKFNLSDTIHKNEVNAANLTSIKVNNFINNMLQNLWTDKNINTWKELRELVLKHPTAAINEFDKSFIIKNFYMKMPKENNKAWYTQKDDYNEIQTSFSKAPGLNEISAESCRLAEFMEIPLIKEYFRANGYAEEFKANAYIMSPPLFNNIYKGALGEVAGMLLWNEFCDEKLEEIATNEHFELFDFKVTNRPAYVDFKHWKESTIFSDKEMLDKISAKAKKCNAQCVFIVNLLAKHDFPVTRRTYNGTRIIQLPAFILNKKVNIKYLKVIKEELYALSNQN